MIFVRKCHGWTVFEWFQAEVVEQVRILADWLGVKYWQRHISLVWEWCRALPSGNPAWDCMEAAPPPLPSLFPLRSSTPPFNTVILTRRYSFSACFAAHALKNAGRATFPVWMYAAVAAFRHLWGFARASWRPIGTRALKWHVIGITVASWLGFSEARIQSREEAQNSDLFRALDKQNSPVGARHPVLVVLMSCVGK